MFFAPYVIRGSNAEKVLVQILPASPEDLAATKGTPSWQTAWESEYLSQPSVDKFALKLENGELLTLGAYQISGRKAYDRKGNFYRIPRSRQFQVRALPSLRCGMP